MPARRLRLLAWLLLGAAALAAGAAAGSLGLDRLAAARGRIRRLEARIEASRRQGGSVGEDRAEDLRREIAEMLSRRYRRGEMSPYRFGTIVRHRLAYHGITVRRYAVLEEAGSTAIEFSVEAGVRSLLAFLQEVSSSPKSWAIPSLSVSPGGGPDRLEAVFRIGYEMVDEPVR